MQKRVFAVSCTQTAACYGICMNRRGSQVPLALFLTFLTLSQTLAEEVPAEKPLSAPLQYEHGTIRIPAASFDEAKAEVVSVQRAEKYLHDASLAWSGKHKCISCHTNGTYMVVRPALTKTLGRPDEANREFFIAELESRTPENPNKKQRGGAPAPPSSDRHPSVGGGGGGCPVGAPPPSTPKSARPGWRVFQRY